MYILLTSTHWLVNWCVFVTYFTKTNVVFIFSIVWLTLNHLWPSLVTKNSAFYKIGSFTEFLHWINRLSKTGYSKIFIIFVLMWKIVFIFQYNWKCTQRNIKLFDNFFSRFTINLDKCVHFSTIFKITNLRSSDLTNNVCTIGTSRVFGHKNTKISHFEVENYTKSSIWR